MRYSVYPGDITIVHSGDLENAQHQASRHPGGQRKWAENVSFLEPAEISVTRPGEFVLEDGHHRYLAARLSGRLLPVQAKIKGKPIERLLEQIEQVGQAVDHKTARQLDAEIREALAGDGGSR